MGVFVYACLLGWGVGVCVCGGVVGGVTLGWVVWLGFILGVTGFLYFKFIYINV